MYRSDAGVQNPRLSSVSVLRVEAAVKNKGCLYRAEILLGSRLSPTTLRECLRSREVLNHTHDCNPPTTSPPREATPQSSFADLPPPFCAPFLPPWCKRPGLACPLDSVGSLPAPGVPACADGGERCTERWALTAAKLTLWRVSECLRKASSCLLSPISHSKGSDVLGSCKSLYP